MTQDQSRSTGRSLSHARPFAALWRSRETADYYRVPASLPLDGAVVNVHSAVYRSLATRPHRAGI